MGTKIVNKMIQHTNLSKSLSLKMKKQEWEEVKGDLKCIAMFHFLKNSSKASMAMITFGKSGW